MRRQIKVELQRALQPHTAHLEKKITLCPRTHEQIHRERRKNRQKGYQTKCRLRKKIFLFSTRKSVEATREVMRYHKSSYENNQKHSLKKSGTPETAMEKSRFAPIPLVPFFSVFVSFFFFQALTKLETSSHQKLLIFPK